VTLNDYNACYFTYVAFHGDRCVKVNKDRHILGLSAAIRLLLQLTVCVCPCCWVCRCQRCA